MDDDLRACWRDLGITTPVIETEEHDMEGSLDEAARMAAADLTEELTRHPPEAITPDYLTSLILRGAKLFVKHWLGTLQQQDLGGLIAFMIDGLKLEPKELIAFMHALPDSVLDKFIRSHVGSATGTHALLALEWHRRHDQSPPSYDVVEIDGRPMVRVDTQQGVATFGLNEKFEGPPE
jgi:hypothetical protein